MSSDINVQTFSGKVNITSNLLVGSSHLFVDTINNRVGLVTTTPDAGIHVNSNAYVHTNFRVGSGIVMNDTTGRITAGSFEGDASLLTDVPGDSGSWVNGTDVVHLATTGDKVGIGVNPPLYKLDVAGDINITTGSTLRINGTPVVFSNWTVSGSDIFRSSGNVGIGGTASATNKLKVTGTIESTTGFTGIQESDVPTLSAYATTSALSTGLATKQDSGSYATTSALSTGLATKQDSGSYATTSALSTGLATKQDSGSYATTSALSTGLATKQDSGSYATTSALSTGLATKQDSGSYATTSALSTGLATKQNSGSYAALAGSTSQNFSASTLTTNTRLTLSSTASIRQTSTSPWSGDPGSGVGKIEYHSNRWYIVAGSNSTELLQVRRDGTNKFTIDNNGSISLGTVPAARISGTVSSATTAGSVSTSVTPGSYLTGSAYNGSTARTFAVDATTAATASKIVARDSSGHIFANYLNMSHGVTTRNSDTVFYSSTDTYIRKNNAAGMRSSLGLTNSATTTASASAGNSTIVQRHSSGYIYANYFNTTPNDVTSGVTKVCVETGNDGFIRHGTAASIRTFIGATSADTASTVAMRDGSGDINVRLCRSDYGNQADCGAGIAFRNSTTDNYIRFCTTMSAVRSRIECYGSGSNITRTSFSNGYMIGYQNGPSGGSDAKTNPIYTIGTSHLPTDTSLSNMYGIGYSHGNFTSILTGGWGMYVAADGDARIGLNGSSGHIKCTGYVDAGTEVYCQNWIRTRGNTGHHWESTSNGNGWHIYPKDRADMYMRTGSGNGGLAFCIANTTVRGYIHCTTSNEIGFLNSGRGWSLRMDNSNNCQVYGRMYASGSVSETMTARYYNVSGGNASYTTTRAISVYALQMMRCSEMQVTSDRRIKTDIVDVDDGSALELLRKIQPKTYGYVDTLEKGTKHVYGFIAQEIKELIPEAVDVGEGDLPNIYKYATIDIQANSITIKDFDTSNLNQTDSIIYIDQDDKRKTLKIKSIINSTQLEIEEDLEKIVETFKTSKMEEYKFTGEIFIWGQQVNDFHHLQKSAIWTVATAALQEVDRQLQAEKARNDLLEARVLALENK